VTKSTNADKGAQKALDSVPKKKGTLGDIGTAVGFRGDTQFIETTPVYPDTHNTKNGKIDKGAARIWEELISRKVTFA